MHAHTQPQHSPQRTTANNIRIQRRAHVHTRETIDRIVLELAARLPCGVHAEYVAANRSYLRGAIGMALSLQLITEEHAILLSSASDALLTPPTYPQGSRLHREIEHDADFARLIVAVRRNAGASSTEPAEIAEMSTDDAQKALQRLQKAGVLNGPDVRGFHPLRTREV